MAGELLEVPSDREALPRPRPTRLPAESPSSGRLLLEQNFDLIRDKLERLGRRSGLSEHEAEEFRSWALFKLVENDYRILASWEGRSSLSTYLNVVLVNLLRDYRSHVWGKWRPSAVARRQGREAILLERLWLRDGLSLTEAIDRMRTEHEVGLPVAELERIAASLPQRTEKRKVSEKELCRIAIDGRVEERVEDAERSRLAARLREELLPRLRALPVEDRVLLRLHFCDGLPMAAISPILGRPQRELYSLRDRCLSQLRRSLQEIGLGRSEAREILDGELPELFLGEAQPRAADSGTLKPR